MKKYRWIFYLCLFSVSLSAQDLQSVWSNVESNNLTLKAARQQVEAARIGTRVGLAPDNPEVEFAYLWGSPDAIGNRIDFSVKQSFYFPTTYVYQGRIARLQSQHIDFAYQNQCREMFLSVANIYYDIVYQNVRIQDMEHCLQYLSDISAAYKQKLETGTINVFEYNKVKLAELNLQQEKSHAEAERTSLLLQLRQLNGDIEVNVAVAQFPEWTLPADFDTWYASLQLPALSMVDKAAEINQQQTKLAKSMWAPQFFAGYMREQVPYETFQGVKVGLTIPLWRDANTVKQMKLQNSAVQLLAADERFKTYSRLKSHYVMVQSLQQQIADYAALLSSVDALALLRQALDAGQISLVDYLFESSIYHESHERFAALEHDAAMEYVELLIQ